jgi:transposase
MMEAARDGLKAGDVFYYPDEFNLSRLPTSPTRWSPRGQQVMIPTPAPPTNSSGIGAVNYHTRETLVRFRQHKRRPEIAQGLQALLDKHLTPTISVAWEDKANPQEDDPVEALVRPPAARLVLLYLPTYSPWWNPFEMLWRQFRREVAHAEVLETIKTLLAAAQHCFQPYKQCPPPFSQ